MLNALLEVVAQLLVGLHEHVDVGVDFAMPWAARTLRPCALARDGLRLVLACLFVCLGRPRSIDREHGDGVLGAG